MTESAATVVLYAVAHVDRGGQHITRYRDRDDAERALWDCRADDADCYLVRARVAWEKVPDGE